MHRQKHGAGPNAIGDLHLHRYRTAARSHLGPGPINQAGASRIAWMHLKQRLGVGLKSSLKNPATSARMDQLPIR